MIFNKDESLIDIVDGNYLSEMTEEEFTSFCDIPTTELSFALGYYIDSLELPQRCITIADGILFKIYEVFKRIFSDINNDSLSDNWKSKLYSNIIPKICLADHYRKEIDKEYQEEVLDIKKVSLLVDEINELYIVLQNMHPNISIDDINQDKEIDVKKRIITINTNKNSL